ncbi:MAG TPA: protein kinase [Vicinamibacteria bacterium]|nr:protein kinase [Vicinamibacteria bacterium]
MIDGVLTSGAIIGSYQVIDRLGAGGMGEVYRARDTRLGRLVAIKVLRRGADPELLHRLQREARAASALNHPNIVHIYDVGEADAHAGAYYVVMEHVQGESLRRRMAPGPLPIPEVLDLGAQLADGLSSAHRAGVVHRDLKPENLMVTPNGLLKILDFGLAKLVVAPLESIDARETLSRHGTQAGLLVGTLEYMSPEQATGRVVDHRTDQFSLGAILYEMVTGRRPFQRETPAQVLAALIERDPEPIERLRRDVPAALASLVARCLQKDPRSRFAATDELASQLVALAGRFRSGAPVEPAVVSHGASSAVPVELLPQPAHSGPARYHVETRRGVRVYDEAELVRLIRRDKLNGTELVRRDDEERWQPLFESQVYRREIPTIGDPRDAARLRMLRGVAGHFTGFFITSVVMFATQGHFPFWLAIWGAVLAVQTLGAIPAAWALFRRRRVEADPQTAAPALPRPEDRQLASPAGPSVSSTMAQEAARVRSLIEHRGGPEASRLIAEVDRILELTARLAARQADLEDQTSQHERDSLSRACAEAEARLDRAELEQDRRLFERQLEVLKGREEAIAKAVRVLERLQVRRDVVEHQLKQLRLDLSRDAASGLDVPELSSRLEFIRFEVDAKEEVEELGAARG